MVEPNVDYYRPGAPRSMALFLGLTGFEQGKSACPVSSWCEFESVTSDFRTCPAMQLPRPSVGGGDDGGVERGCFPLHASRCVCGVVGEGYKHNTTLIKVMNVHEHFSCVFYDQFVNF